MANEDTGQGTTIAFTGFTANPPSFTVTPISINMGEFVREALEKTTLASTLFKEYKPADLSEPNEAEVTAFFDSTSTEQPFASSADTYALQHDPLPGTMTITLPEQIEAGNPPSFAGTGFVMQTSLPELATDTLMVVSFRFKYDGGTGPTWTEDAAS